MTEVCHSETLANGLVANFFDLTNRYFGDFHRVCILVQILLPVADMQLSVEQQRLLNRLKKPPCFEKQLERMGVATLDVSSVRDALISGFLATGRGYLEKPDFAQRLLQKKLLEKPQRPYLRSC